MLEIFTDNWDEPPALNDGERLCRIVTTNPCDSMYAVRTREMDGEEHEDEFHAEVRLALRRKLGRRGPSAYLGFEDVTDLYYYNAEGGERWDTRR